ncbi:minor capsid protein [Alces alces faeces associated microvirus MP10 5560]|uniref:minor capsid protein n=1 Tax=Alces alces faeces associated microvirus MP10 5560 TaxID=2219133 RepID=UPI000DF04F80|nr:minor capsid protein [Alces alces faeces associated microvirus MP10 5560]AXB22564.1 minor capsid protein [Alces alces faeces associated microvirus MP10 5560]
MFYTRTKKRPTEPTASGEKERNTYSIKMSEFGHKEVYQSGKTNQYEKTQEAAEGTKIKNIVKRFSLGDTEALNKAHGMYLDMTELPENLAEAQQSIQQIENIFNLLPIETRAEYNHNASEFISDFGSEKFIKAIMPKTKPKMPEPVKTKTEKKGGDENN